MKRTKAEAQKTRQHLLAAALEVFWHTGVTRASLQEIAQEAGVTRGALYWHFKNKEDLFEALFEQKHTLLTEMLNDDVLSQQPDVWAHLRHSLLHFCNMLHEDESHRKFCQVLMTKCEQTKKNQFITNLMLRYRALWRYHVEQAIKLSIQQKSLPCNTYIALSVLYLESNMIGLLTLWTNEPTRFLLPEMAQHLINAIMNNSQNGLFVQAT